MNKKINLLFTACCVSFLLIALQLQAVEKSGFKYVDAKSLTIINRTQAGEPSLKRLDVDKYPQLPPTVKSFYKFSTGLAVVFKTNSKSIKLRWKLVPRNSGGNMTLLSQKGFDLYIKKDNNWIFAGIGMPKKDIENEATVIENMDGSYKTCMLYMPLFAELENLEIGIDESCSIESIENPFKRKVVVIGSSITHGASASRPGMTYAARLERSLGIEFTNLGVSGMCKVEDFYARIAADSNADAFLFDVFSNPSAQQIRDRFHSFVEIIRRSHPNVPLIFLQTEIRETCNFNEKTRDYELNKRMAAEEEIRKIKEVCYKDIYFINPGIYIGNDHDATVDGVHPTDMGFDRMLIELQPKLKKILRKYGIK